MQLSKNQGCNNLRMSHSYFEAQHLCLTAVNNKLMVHSPSQRIRNPCDAKREVSINDQESDSCLMGAYEFSIDGSLFSRRFEKLDNGT